MPVSALEIASFFVQRGVSPLKLQKLLYYAQVWYFVKFGNKLFSDDIKAWVFGPVVPATWQEFKYMRRTSTIPQNRIPDFQPSDDIANHLKEVWDSYGHLSGAQLVDLTHSEDPWRLSRIGLLSQDPSKKPVVIDKNTTANYKLINGKIPYVDSKPSWGQYSNQHF